MNWFFKNVLYIFSSIQNNVTAILDKLQRGYDKRVRPNYGGKFLYHRFNFIQSFF